MERARLQEFLKNAMDLEGAAYGCDQTIETLNFTIQKGDNEYFWIPEPIFPASPRCEVVPAPRSVSKSREEASEEAKQYAEREYPRMDIFNFVWKRMRKFYTGAIVIAGVICLLLNQGASRADAMLPIMGVVIVLTLVLGAMICYRQFGKMNGKRNEVYERLMSEYDAETAACERARERFPQEKRAAQMRYELAKQEHERQCNDLKKQRAREWQAAHQVVERYRQELRAQRDQVLRRRVELKAALQRLYDEHGFYENYRNLPAVSQLYEYIASGISSQLEGPDGAYAQYAADLRAERICGSVEELRRDMNAGFEHVSGMQQVLLEELQECGDKIQELRGSITDFGGNVSALIKGVQNETRMLSEGVQGQMEASQRRQEQLLGSVAQIEASSGATAFNTSMIALNQYLDAKACGADAYYATHC